MDGRQENRTTRTVPSSEQLGKKTVILVTNNWMSVGFVFSFHFNFLLDIDFM